MGVRRGENYIFKAAVVALIVIGALYIISYIPSFYVGDRLVKRVNILSDIVETPVDMPISVEEDTLLIAQADSLLMSLEAEILEEKQREQQRGQQEQGAQSTAAEVKSVQAPATEPWEITAAVGTAPNSITDLGRPLLASESVGVGVFTDIGDAPIVEIEDFGAEQDAMHNFQMAMTRRVANRPVRIAVLGDSFIENDIITADLRESFQSQFGGNGVGYVSFSTPIAKYRQTIKHTFEGWETYSVMSYKKTPEKYQDKFAFSGLISIPEEGATVTMEGSDFRKYISGSTVAKLLFINEKRTQIEVTINGESKRVFNPESSSAVQEIVITGKIEKFEMSLHNVDGFVGYGVVFEDRSGVTVDNYSVRGTSGLPLFNTDATINRKINDMLGYDLIVLQYGLNVMQVEVLKYDSFSKSLSRIIRYVKSCFPNSSILVMGVGDRGQKDGDKVETMKAVYGVLEAQRSAAESEGVAFWSAFEAMGGHNSMIEFVERGWAAKDYLHIGYGGGRYIAQQMYRSLMDFEVEQKVETQAAVVDSLGAQVVVDSLRVDSLSGGQDSIFVGTDSAAIVLLDSLLQQATLEVDSTAVIEVMDSLETTSIEQIW